VGTIFGRLENISFLETTTENQQKCKTTGIGSPPKQKGTRKQQENQPGNDVEN